MRSFFLSLLILVAGSGAHAQLEGSKTKPFIKPDPTKKAFGAPLTSEVNPITAEQAVSQFKSLSSKENGKTFLIEAQVEKVCEKKGCWMAVKAGDHDMRIIFKDYGFFVPPSLLGKKVLAEGYIKEKQLTLEETKHFVQDEGKDPSTVTAPIKDYQFVASGIKLVK